ncbi:MAG: dihydrodipicolinate synthase family protein [Burkholderiales bacterium]|nr:dihydrodipicolinate synthase family protein [Burkholderiales bacterium]
MYPIVYAFFAADGALDRAAMRRQIRACVANPAHGVAALGLATEVGKLSAAEKRTIIEWVAQEVGAARPLAVTISGDSVDEQADLAAFAAAAGADWLILQPPRERDRPESHYFDFFAEVMARTDLPCAIQNAPEYLGVGLTPQAIARLALLRRNFVLLKGEGPAVRMREVIEANPGMAVFNGRGGLELPDNLRAGCAGMIIGVDSFDWQARAFDAWRRGDHGEADRLYAALLPGVVFMMQSIDHLVCYGKRIAALRLGVDVHDRAPALAPTAFGLEAARRFAAALGPLA